MLTVAKAFVPISLPKIRPSTMDWNAKINIATTPGTAYYKNNGRIRARARINSFLELYFVFKKWLVVNETARPKTHVERSNLVEQELNFERRMTRDADRHADQQSMSN